MDERIDEVLVRDRWEFDCDVTACFDDMLRRSIPQYDVMRTAVFDIADVYRKQGTAIIDLGASRGEALSPFTGYADENNLVAVETSKPMLAALRERFQVGEVEISDLDLRTQYPKYSASVTLCILTLQFIPIEHRQRLVQRIYDHTLSGGCLIVVEKVLGADAELDDMMVENYLTLKSENGYTSEQIDRKRLSLEGVLVPITAAWNEDLLRQAGFKNIDCFWRWMNFAGWVAVK